MLVEGEEGPPEGPTAPPVPPPEENTFFGLPTALRPDGRLSATTLRPLKLELGPLGGPNGSARFTQGLTVALATVVGPLDARGAPPTHAGISVVVKQLCQPPTGPRMEAAAAAARAAAVAGEQQSVQRAVAAAAYTSGGGPQGGGRGGGLQPRRALDWGRCMEHRLEQLLQAAVHTPQFPRCLIQVVVLLQQDDGSREAVCCNAAFAAVMHAGLPLRWRGWALCLASPPQETRKGPPPVKGSQGDCAYLDPTREEEAAAARVDCVITDPTTGRLLGAFSCMRVEARPEEAVQALGASGVRGAPQGALGGLATAAARAVDAEARLKMDHLLRIATAAWGAKPERGHLAT